MNKSKNKPKYSGVPTNDLINCLFLTILDNPKSVKLICPFSSRRIFSGLRSL